MTILASRQHTCIHPTVSKMGNKEELCKKLRKNEMPRESEGFAVTKIFKLLENSQVFCIIITEIGRKTNRSLVRRMWIF